MKTSYVAVLLSLAVGAQAAPRLGQPAPDFTVSDQSGKPVKLSDAKGKFVVLEWYNKGCPFVRKHYDAKNMQALQKKYAKKGVVWYTVSTGKKGKEGHMAPEEAAAQMKAEGMASAALLRDESGDVGRAYSAKTTPHLFVIDKKGVLIYQGGIDDKASADSADIKSSKNFVAAALDEALAGKPVSTPSSTPYGCSVKY